MGAITILALIIVVFFVFKTMAAFSKYKAALNALLAKATYEELDSTKKQAVAEQAMEIMARGGISDAELRMCRLPERERYSFFALAMAELGISPALTGYSWQIVENPFVALLNAENQIRAAQRDLRKKHGIAISI